MRGPKPKLIDSTDAIAVVPKPPRWMATAAKAEWRRIMPVLVERRILTAADIASVENFCVAVGRARELEVRIQEAEDVDPVLIRLQDKAMQTARQLAAELGLTPVSRSRPSVRGERADEDDNPLAV